MNTTRKIIIFTLFVFVTLNIYISQGFPKQMYQILVNKDSDATLDLLIDLQKDNQFGRHVKFFSDYTGVDYAKYFNSIELTKKVRISRLESLLQINPKQPQLLRQLAKEYAQIGDSKKSKEISRLAHTIDPLNY